MPEPLLYAKAIAAAALAAALFLLATLGSRRESTTWLNSVCVMAIGFGLLIGYYLLSLNLAWPPAGALDRLLTIVIPTALAVELIAGIQRTPRSLAWLLRLSLAAMVSRILLHGSVYLSDWSRLHSGAAMLVFAVLLSGTWILLSRLYECSPGVSIPLALCLTILSAGMTVMMAGYIKGGAAAVPLAATLVATTIAAMLITKRSGTNPQWNAVAIIGIGVVGLFGVLFIGRFFGRISTGDALTLLLAPLLCWVTEIPPLRGRKPWLVASLRIGLVGIPLVLVLAAARAEFSREMAPLLVMRTPPTIQHYFQPSAANIANSELFQLVRVAREQFLIFLSG
jgi:hypothetical protein